MTDLPGVCIRCRMRVVWKGVAWIDPLRRIIHRCALYPPLER